MQADGLLSDPGAPNGGKDGAIQAPEFEKFMQHKYGFLKGTVFSLFASFDEDDDGSVSEEEMNKMFQTLDKDGSGQVDEWEFVNGVGVFGWSCS